MNPRRIAMGACWIGAVFFVAIGLWAFLDPKSFYDNLAEWPPYNRHLFHDVGAFQLGLGVAFLAGIARRSGIAVALWGGSTAATIHAISHFIDADRGGRDSDPWLLTGFALLLVIGLIASERKRT